jgi:hypothetical protein
VVTLLPADKRVNPNIANKHGGTALMCAADRGHASVVTLLLADKRVDPNIANQKGSTALMVASTDTVAALLRANPRVIDAEREQAQAEADAAMAALLDEEDSATASAASSSKAKEKNKNKKNRNSKGSIGEGGRGGGGGGGVGGEQDTTTIRCTKCEVRKPSSEFSKTQQKKARQQGGRGTQCVECANLGQLSPSLSTAAARKSSSAAAEEPNGDMKNAQPLSSSSSSYSKANGKQKKALGEGGGYDECAYCMKSDGSLLLQCRYCHAVRYCDELCLKGHWNEGHGRLCQPALFAPQPPPPSASPGPPPSLPLESAAAEDQSASGGGSDGRAAATATVDGDGAFDAAVAAALLAAGVENAHGVARALHEEEFDVETLRMVSFDDVEEFGIVDAATMQRVHECLPPAAAPPPLLAAASSETGDMSMSAAAAAAEATPSAGEGKTTAASNTAPRPPLHLCCPITLELFIDPVQCVGDGETYERSAIERHIRDRQAILEARQKELEDTNGESERAQGALEHGITSPMGHGTLETTALVPARMAKRMADEWRAGNRVE